jgi:plastocyanin domain-containing protein
MNVRLLGALAALPLAIACSKGEPAASKTTPAEQAQPAIGRPDAEGKVHIQATADAFIPSRVEVKGGESFTLVFLREVERSCMNKVVFPGLDIEKELPVGEPVEIRLVAPKDGTTIAFQCPMAMGKSLVVPL